MFEKIRWTQRIDNILFPQVLRAHVVPNETRTIDQLTANSNSATELAALYNVIYVKKKDGRREHLFLNSVHYYQARLLIPRIILITCTF